MTPDGVEVAVCDYIRTLYPSASVYRAALGAVTSGLPRIAVAVVSDVETSATDQIETDAGTVYTSHRRCRVQVDVAGGETSRTIAHRIAARWTSDDAGVRAAIAAGVGPSGVGEVRMVAAVRQPGVVRGASVDLIAHYRWTDAPVTDPAQIVTSYSHDVQGVDGPDIVGAYTPPE